MLDDFSWIVAVLSILVSCQANVSRMYSVEFESRPQNELTIRLLEINRSYEVTLTPNHEVYHQDFKVTVQGHNEKVERSEFQASLLGHVHARGQLSKLSDKEFVGALQFDNDTLQLEPRDWHPGSTQKSVVVAYFQSDVIHSLDVDGLVGYIEVNPTSVAAANPFLKYRRKKREASPHIVENEKKNRCPLKIVADYEFFSILGRNKTGITTKYLVNMVARVNEIYTGINWDEGKEDLVSNRGRFLNIGFSIKEIEILERPNYIPGHYNGPPTYGNSWEPEKLLQAFTSEESSRKFCLVHLVTGKTFDDSPVLGMAYTPSSESPGAADGGICSASYNTVFTSAMGINKKVRLTLVTQSVDIVVAHEYGHSFGAVHDPPIDGFRKSDNLTSEDVENCSPSFRDGGFYIMNSYAQSGYDRNNLLFSSCSRRSVRKVLEARWSGCFEEEKTSFCGNGVIEEGEQCDNGGLLNTGEASCCTSFCELASYATCSPKNHICCTESCQFHNSSHVCLPADPMHCKRDSVCNGVSGDCPTAPPSSDGSQCIEEGECQGGFCVPYCEKKIIGKKSCICEDLDLACLRCCASNGTCLPEPGALNLRDGTSCSQGYCKNSKCVTEVADHVRVYFDGFRDGSRFGEFLKSMMVPVVIIVVSVIWTFGVYFVKQRDIRMKNLNRKAQNLRRVNVGAIF